MESWYRIQAALLAAVICFALAVAVLFRSKTTVPPWRFATLALNLCAIFLADAAGLAELWSSTTHHALQTLAQVLLPWSATSLLTGFAGETERRADAVHLISQILSGILLASTALLWMTSGLSATSQSFEQALVYIDYTTLGALVLQLTLSVSVLIQRARELELRSERTRLISLTIGSSSVLVIGVLSYTLHLGVAWLGNLLPAVFLLFVYQVVTLRRILDVTEFIGRITVLAGFALVLSTLYVLLVVWWRHDLGLFFFNTSIASVVMLILLDPLRQVFETRLLELVFRDRYEFTRLTEQLRRILTNVIDVGAMSDTLMSRLEGSKHITHASIYLRDEEGLHFKRLGFLGTEPPISIDAITNRPFLARLHQHKALSLDALQTERTNLLEAAGESTTEEVELEAKVQAQLELLDSLIATMQSLEAQLVVSFAGQSTNTSPLSEGLDLSEPNTELLGFLCLKNERLREAWSADEIRASLTLAAQATIVIENSRLFDRIRERDRLAAIGQMAAGLAHEIRNPLGAIKGSAQLLAEVDPDQRQTFLQIIQEEVNRLDSVVSQFLTYARPLKGKRDSVDVNHVLERTLTLLQAEPHQATIELITGPSLPHIQSDPELIRQVSLNLSRNAIEAMGAKGGRLTIRTAMAYRTASAKLNAQGGDAGAYIRISFEDEGPGIPPEVMERLFIPFYTTKEKGSGLGLAICQRIVESLGGTIEVQSRIGRGSTFSVFLPVLEPPGRATLV